MIEWIFLERHTACDGWAYYDEYVSADGTLGRNVWWDEYEEIFEI